MVGDNRAMSNDLSPRTVVVHAGRPAREPDAPFSVPPVLASTYVAGGPVGYGRYGNPAWDAFEEVLGELEGGRALAFASGMAAASAVFALVPPGGRVVAPAHAYSGVLELLDQLAGRIVAVDNTFATPLLQRPFEHGADLVVHSATKFLAGHSDVQLGVALTRDDERYDELARHRRLGGAIPGPMETWLALRGLRTLALRLERAQHNAAVLAERLAGHPRIERVRYPGLPGDPGHERAKAQMDGYGAILAIEVAGGAAAAQAVCERTRLWVHATSLGGVESTLERRRRWASESPTIPENLIRLSVGIEDVDDLWRDLDDAL